MIALEKIFFLSALFLLAGPAQAQSRPKQNLAEYLEAALKRDAALSPAEQRAVLDAVEARFAAYASAVVKPGETAGADVVMRMIIEGSFDEAPAERIADVSFAAYQAILRGAPPDAAEGIALYGYRKKLSGDRIGVWANGYQQLVSQKVPPEVAADLVRNAMELGWEDSAFNTLKWSLVQAAREKFDVRDYAVYLFGHMASGTERPGALTARAQTYFKGLAKSKAKPELPAYEGSFSRVPAPPPIYQARPAAQAPRDVAVTHSALWPGLERSSRSYLGTPYVWGGVTKKGIDCSGLTQNTYSENRVAVPRVSRQQWQTGEAVDFSALREGDLVFFNTMGVGVSHVGMVVAKAGPRFIHASSSRGVVIDELTKKYYKTRYLGARRIVP
jgi:cell wall-associated NlpC family hydrolase